MASIRIVPVGRVPRGTLVDLAGDLERSGGIEPAVEGLWLDAGFARHPERGQFHATEILARLAAGDHGSAWRVLGISADDLYIPILTFVFGEAQTSGRCALLSTCRLRQAFYGLPPDPALERGRILKEAIHEIGHTLGLPHCRDRRCVMASSHAVEWIDIKDRVPCVDCRAAGAWPRAAGEAIGAAAMPPGRPA